MKNKYLSSPIYCCRIGQTVKNEQGLRQQSTGDPKTLTPGPRNPQYGPGPWTTYGPVHGLPLRTPEKKTEIKISLTACPSCLSTAIGHSCQFRALRWENVTALSSVSGASYTIDIPHCHCFFPVAICIYERPGNLREVSTFVLL